MNEGWSKTGFLRVPDTYSNTVGPARSLIEQGRKTWFLIVADYACGHQMRTDPARSVEQAGGGGLGFAQHPTSAPDLSSFLLQAQASGAQAIGLLNAGSDTINCVKQANAFGISAQQKLFLRRIRRPRPSDAGRRGCERSLRDMGGSRSRSVPAFGGADRARSGWRAVMGSLPESRHLALRAMTSVQPTLAPCPTRTLQQLGV